MSDSTAEQTSTGSWTPPPVGSVCWIQVGSKDVARAAKFYADVFGWTIDEPDRHSKGYDPNEYRFFHLPGKSGLGGGFVRTCEKETVTPATKAGSYLYFWTEGLEGWADKITAAGGTVKTDVMPQADMGLMQHFEDTEGNYFGLYAVVKK